MGTLTSGIPAEPAENIYLLAMLVGQPGTQNMSIEQLGPLYQISTDGYFHTLVPTELSVKIRANEATYEHTPYVREQFLSVEQQKESEWLELLGETFYELSLEKRDFLLKTAGIFDFGENIDIKKIYKTSIY